ncbi:Hypothetical protein PHPALM_18594 [Phytophthora palmivora]|uniref:Uncharacterized protein n=1 Tax=Phytophthora palmivora TaxID=4796 RepID=A0A2P4XJK0_9STRA|nr:Hypothetical protein PHPALM_18594 [Phytophthora palmivora]
MVRVPGSSGDSQGFHRESDEDATKFKLEPGIEAVAEGVSPQALLSEAGYSHRQSAEAQRWTSKRNLNRLPRLLREPPAERNSHCVSPDEGPLVQADIPSSITTPLVSRKASKKKKSKSTRKKLNVPDSDVEGRGETHNWATDKIEQIYYQRELASFMIENLVMKIVHPEMCNTPEGSVAVLMKRPTNSKQLQS